MGKILLFICISICFSQSYNYSLEDKNQTSDTFGELIGPDYFSGEVTVHYFGHQN
tara:strand:+ start:206 stop:370 length:165 start_codon:yes stop_codon:yes gene_type:complete